MKHYHTISEELQPTLIASSAQSTTLSLLRRTLDTWDLLKSGSVNLNPLNKSSQPVIGQLHGMMLQKQSGALSPTVKRNSEIMAPISARNFQQNSHSHIGESYSLTLQSETLLGEDNKISSLISTSSADSIPLSLPQMESNHHMEARTALELFHVDKELEKDLVEKVKFVTDSTAQTAYVQALPILAGTSTSVNNVTCMATVRENVSRMDSIHGAQPKYLHYNLWNDNSSLPFFLS